MKTPFVRARRVCNVSGGVLAACVGDSYASRANATSALTDHESHALPPFFFELTLLRGLGSICWAVGRSCCMRWSRPARILIPGVRGWKGTASDRDHHIRLMNVTRSNSYVALSETQSKPYISSYR